MIYRAAFATREITISTSEPRITRVAIVAPEPPPGGKRMLMPRQPPP